MKSNEGHPETRAEARTIADTVNFTNSSAKPKPYNYSLMEISIRMNEEGQKLGRRYSFDDNGGGYKGL
ncbi:MAG TPA: hypothetical protein VEV15_01600 [Flavisolibacter sp.]|nr:hypothetical protein [Flavisolibacter sp.]